MVVAALVHPVFPGPGPLVSPLLEDIQPPVHHAMIFKLRIQAVGVGELQKGGHKLVGRGDLHELAPGRRIRSNVERGQPMSQVKWLAQNRGGRRRRLFSFSHGWLSRIVIRLRRYLRRAGRSGTRPGPDTRKYPERSPPDESAGAD